VDEALRERLREGTEALGLALPDDALQRCIAYLRELERWNRTYNLTAVRDVGEMVGRHLLDSLAVLPLVAGPRVADAGSGAGLPGIPLAIAAPAVEHTLIEANARKIRFLRHVAGVLALRNVQLAQARLEGYQPAAAFDTVVARALAPLPRLVELIGHLCAADGRIVALKGRRPDDEIDALPSGWEIAAVTRLFVPQVVGERHAVVLRRSSAREREGRG
jgi:16S rRNA (guanine527-N7)-methyltransferase